MYRLMIEMVCQGLSRRDIDGRPRHREPVTSDRAEHIAGDLLERGHVPARAHELRMGIGIGIQPVIQRGPERVRDPDPAQ